MSFSRGLSLIRKGTFIRQLTGASASSQSKVKTDGEKKLEALLKSRFQPDTESGTIIFVEDISSRNRTLLLLLDIGRRFIGGCGSMFNVRVQSPLFAGLSRVQQHKMITETLRGEIKSMHGLVIETATPK